MADDLHCYRCGESLASLSLPLSRQDECPSCSVYLHVCKMCDFYDANVPRQCREDGADEVIEKERLNFCEWFKPGQDVFDGVRAREESQARDALNTLFGESETSEPSQDEQTNQADKLFK
jgi:hypothetical protein